MTTPLQTERERRGMTRTQLSHASGVTVREIREWEEGYLVRPSAHKQVLDWIPRLEVWFYGHQATWDLLVTHHGSATRSELERELHVEDLEGARDKARLAVSPLDLMAYLSPRDSPAKKQSFVQCLSRGGDDKEFIGLDRSAYDDVKHDVQKLLRLKLVEKFRNGLGQLTESVYSTRAGRTRCKLEVVVLRERALRG